MKLEIAGTVLGAAIMVAVSWAMWAYHQRELDRALSDLRDLS